MQNKYDEIMRKLKCKHLYQGDFHEITDVDIDGLEKKLGHAIPSDYRIFLTKFGVTSSETGIVGPEDTGVEVFYGINFDGNYDLFHCWSILSDRFTNTVLPIAKSSGGEICLLLAGDHVGGVYWWNRERSFVPEDSLFLASSFDSFLRSLTVEPKL